MPQHLHQARHEILPLAQDCAWIDLRRYLRQRCYWCLRKLLRCWGWDLADEALQIALRIGELQRLSA